MTLAQILGDIAFIVAGAVSFAAIYRWRGKDNHPRPIGQSIIAGAFGLLAGFAHYVVMTPSWQAAVYGLIVFAVTLAALCTGHGQYFPELAVKPIKPERTDFALRPFFGKDPRTRPDFAMASDTGRQVLIEAYGRDRLRRRCADGMFLTGALVLAPFGVAVGGWMIPLYCGIAKAAAYSTMPTTEDAERYFGSFLGGVAAVLFLIMYYGAKA